MRLSRPVRRADALLLLLVVATGCRHVTVPPAALPAGWEALRARPQPVAALYRLSCCGHRNLLVTIRGGGEGMSVVVAAPPGGTVAQAWLAQERGWLLDRDRCRVPLPPGRLPLADGGWLPLDSGLAAVLLAGRLPERSRAAGDAGWAEASAPDGTIRLRVAPDPARVVEVAVEGERGSLLNGTLSEHHGTVPGRLLLHAGDEKVEMELVEWAPGAPVEPPVWMALPVCQGAAR